MFKFFRFPATLIPLLLLGCSAEPSSQREAEMNVAETVLAIEDDYVEAEINRDEAALRKILDDEFVYNSNSGQTSSKEQLISNVLGWNMTGQTISERTVVVTGDTAVIFGTTELRFASDSASDSDSDSDSDEDIVQLLRYTSTYTNKGGEWKFLALHMAPRTPSA